MKHLKLYEDKKYKKYWKIKIDKYFIPRLNKINVIEEEQKSAYKHYIQLKKENTFVSIVFVQKDIYGTYCNFNPNDEQRLISEEYIKQNDTDFKLSEIEKVEWDMKDITKKFNI